MTKGLEQSLEKRVDRISRRLLRWRWIAASTIGFAGFSFWLGKADGWEFLPAGLGWLLFAGITASITWARDRQARKDKENAVGVAKRMWATLNGAGLPVIAALGSICSRTRPSGSTDPRTTLLTRVLDSTRLRLGDDTTSNRASYYERTDRDTLTLVDWAGGLGPPRHRVWRRNDPAGPMKFAVLDGMGSRFEDVPNVREANIPGFVLSDAGYLSYLTTRVTAGEETFGLLCVDSPIAGNFTERDKTAISLLAGLLGAGEAAAGRVPVTPGTLVTGDTPTDGSPPARVPPSG
jgi:hypothetical protein